MCRGRGGKCGDVWLDLPVVAMCRGRGGKCGDVWLDVRRGPVARVAPHPSHHVGGHTVHTAVVKGV